MRHFSKWLLVGVTVVSLATAALAQDEKPAAGEGGPIIAANLGSDIKTLNPILSNDGSSAAIIARLFPVIVGVNPDTLNYDVNQRGALATKIDISEDGLTYTITLRDDWNWSDGTPITSADYKYAFDAIASGETNTALTYVLDYIESVEAPDAHTVVVTAKAPGCTVLNNISFVPVVPAHIYSERFPTFADMNESDFNLQDPGATAGIWKFGNFRPGEQVTLLADTNYPDAHDDYVIPEGYVYRNVADETLILEQFIAGDLTFAQAPAARNDDLRAMGTEGTAQVSEVPAASIQFIGLNQADPTNPQPGLDEEGNAIDQGHHPIFGDVRVRQALMYAMNWEALNQAALNGEGVQLASHVLPTSWAFDATVPLYEYDVEKAAALLEEAGWVDDDNDPATPRVAKGALYAEDGTLLAFTLETNTGNDSSEAIGTLLQEQWGAVGFDVDFQQIDFNILLDEFTGQTYDAVMLFWGFSFPDNPDDASANFLPSNDVPGSGFNVTSYNNPRVTEILTEANQVAGCDQTTRANLYKEMFQILRDDAPWIWLDTSVIVVGAQTGVQNWDPLPGLGVSWNEDSWIVPVSD